MLLTFVLHQLTRYVCSVNGRTEGDVLPVLPLEFVVGSVLRRLVLVAVGEALELAHVHCPLLNVELSVDSPATLNLLVKEMLKILSIYTLCFSLISIPITASTFTS